MMLQGALGELTTTQESQVSRHNGGSLSFRETTERKGDNRYYDVVFDANEGLVRARRGPGDEATIPLIQPYRDPLSLLLEIRELGTPDQPVRVPMLGKEVTVLYLGETELDTTFGKRTTYAYRLHPGNAYVYVDTASPHPIVQMSQRVDGKLLDTLLVKVAQEDAMPARQDDSPGPRRGKRRRRRRRRKR